MTESVPRMSEPVLRAKAWSGESYDDPTDEALSTLLREMNLRHRFVIVDRLDRMPADAHFMQLYLHDDMSCQVEFREGGPDQHFQTRVAGPFDTLGQATVGGVLKGWARDLPGWRESLTWLPWAPPDERAPL